MKQYTIIDHAVYQGLRFEYKGHKTYIDLSNDRAAFVCIDPSKEIYYDYMTNQWEEIIKN